MVTVNSYSKHSLIFNFVKSDNCIIRLEDFHIFFLPCFLLFESNIPKKLEDSSKSNCNLYFIIYLFFFYPRIPKNSFVYSSLLL